MPEYGCSIGETNTIGGTNTIANKFTTIYTTIISSQNLEIMEFVSRTIKESQRLAELVEKYTLKNILLCEKCDEQENRDSVHADAEDAGEEDVVAENARA